MSSLSVLHPVQSLCLFLKFSLLSLIQGCYPPAPYSEHPYILTSFLTSSPHLAHGLHAYLSPLGCTFSSPLGIQKSYLRVTGPVHRSLAILITAEISFQTAVGNFIFATVMSRLALRHVLRPVLLEPSTPYYWQDGESVKLPPSSLSRRRSCLAFHHSS
jgi:hypothetical protein